MTERKRLFFDIETSPNIGFFWSAGYKLQIGYENIITERAIICICFKWEGEKKVHALHWDVRKQCDKRILIKFIRIASEADEIIGHNGDRYDLPWLRTRCLLHGIEMFPDYTSVDTLKISKSRFRFNSNRLDYIGQYLGLGGKIKTEYSLWKNIVLNKCLKSLDKMIQYCQRDVRLLEKVYQRLAKYAPHKVHYGVLAGHARTTCPECGNSHVRSHQIRVTAAGYKRIRLQCLDHKCGRYFTIPESAFKQK
ncbi:MAG: hypothetical protein EOO01_11500 [Chitinophagaceae bacterium]|nr:MAG: hypothetical protein EOO01_11500 [Chitinophagaceae bacterium]